MNHSEKGSLGNETGGGGPRAGAPAVEPVAVVGIGCRFPGGKDPQAFWRTLVNRVDAVTEVPADRWSARSFYDPDPGRPGKILSRWGGFLAGVDRFDARFFGISPREAARMDPQQRLLLEVAWEALEDAGEPREKLAGSATGVFIGVSCRDYYELQTAGREGRAAIDAHTATGGAASIVANRLSYAFDLRGPSLSVDTACSSSLVAVHLACRSLWNGESATALAGGVNVMISPPFFVCLSKLNMLSPDGRCKAFDARADGYVRGEGAGVVVLKPLSRARADGDRVYAVIRGSAVSQDGRTPGITVPSSAAQAAAVRDACELAGVAPERLGYVEAHGTGTPVGDPLEAAALGEVLGPGRAGGDACLVGSVKTNIGHLESAAGIAGLIKVVLALSHERIPASLHFETPHPEIPFAELKLRVADDLVPWPAGNGERLAGVNSFGFGGTNAHVVLGDPPPLEAAPRGEPPHPGRLPQGGEGVRMLVPLSAQRPEALRGLARRWTKELADGGGLAAAELVDLAHSAALRRTHHDRRLAVTAASREELRDGLAAFLAGEARAGLTAGRRSRDRAPQVVFVFCGQGPQWWAMARELFASEPVFRDRVERAAAAIPDSAPWRLLDELGAAEDASRLDRTDILQPAIFAVQVGLAALWRSWGVTPAAVVGHSMGEVAAAHVAGILDLEDAARVIYHRGRLQQRSRPGRMMAVHLAPAELEPRLEPYRGRLWISGVNAPAALTLAGEVDAVEELAAHLQDEDVFCRVLRVACACHSPHMEDHREELLASLAGIEARPAEIPLYSAVTGEPVAGGELGADYWWTSFRRPVAFRDAAGRLLADGYDAFVEIGPHPVLATYLRECAAERGAEVTVLASLHRKQDDKRTLSGSLGALYCAGAPVAWERVLPPGGRYVPLPSYPWQRERYWHEPPASLADRTREHLHPLLGRRLPASQPCWENELDPRVLSYLADHRIQGTTVVPGVAYVLMALAAAPRVFGADGACHLEGVELLAALFLPGGKPALCQLNLAPDDGAFEVWSRTERDDWVRHARGKAVFDKRARELAGRRRTDLAELRGRLSRSEPGTELYRRAARRGIELGPAFQGVRKTWTGDREALAEIRLPDAQAAEAASYLVHPVVLDACFQVSLAILGAERPGLYLPVRVERVRLGPVPGGTLWGHARVVEDYPRALQLDLRLMDEEGGVVAEAWGLRFQAVDVAAADGGDAEAELYAPRWERLAPAAASMPRPEEVVRRVEPEARRLFEQLGRAGFYDDFAPALHHLCGRFVTWAFGRLGWRGTPGKRIAIEDLARRLGIAARHERLLRRMLEILEEEGFLARGTVARSWSGEEPGEGWRRLAGRHPAYVAELDFLWRFGAALPGVLRGEKDPLELLFPDGSTAAAEHLYQDAPISRIYNKLVPRAVETVYERLPPERTVRVLELGGGTGGMTSYLLPALPPERTEYVFTDVSPLFTGHARQKLGADAGRARFEVLDLQQDPAEQGFEPGTFDVVVASDVLHATRDLGESLEHARALLAGGGLFLALEATERTRWADLVFGQTEGWWAFRDFGRRPDHPLLRRERWLELFRESGFAAVASLSEPVASPARCLFVAQAPPAFVGQAAPADSPGGLRAAGAACPTEPSWLVFQDRGGLGARLGTRLGELGHDWTAAPDDPAELAAFLVQWRERTGAKRIVHLRSLSGAAFATAAELEAAQGPGVEDVLFVIQALEQAGLLSGESTGTVDLTLVTRGARAAEVGASPAAASDRAGLAQAPLWGLARAVRHEYPGLRCKSVDLDGSAGVEALLGELAADDGEEEVALYAGERYAERLVHRPWLGVERRTTGAGAADGPWFRLEAPRPGLLDGLGLFETPRRPPGPGEAEVEILAAGLNFKDLMIALGLLADEAVEKSYGGPLFGTECAGRIAALGEGVEGFAPGDEVVAVAPACFAPFTTTSATLVVPKPPGMSFEAAAGVPIAFLTAYYGLVRLARLVAGERVLIHSATGGMGLAAIEIARRAGAEVMATAGRPEKRDFLRALGVERPMDSRSLAFAEEVMEATGGRGVDVVLNSLSGPAIEENLALLAPYGRYVEVGKTDIYENGRVGLWPFRNNLSFFALDMSRLCLDRPQVVSELLGEVMALFAAGELRPLPHRVFPIGRVGEAFRAMSKARHLGKIVLSLDHETAPVVPRGPEPLPVRDDRTYLVTGGLGGLGLLVARRLVDSGARHLLLAGRRGAADEGARRVVSALEESGARVAVVAADVAREDDVDRLFAEIGESLPPLAGVVHAAMVLEDALLSRMEAASLRRVMAPKVLGAWNLHRRTLDTDLDFFVLFSSVAGLLGSAGQGNYAAANAFLDALAHHRRRLGLPALAVDWGRLGEAGYVARHAELGPLLERQGILELTPEKALSALTRMLRRDPVQVAVARLDWRRWRRSNPSAAAAPRFAGLAAGVSPETAAAHRPESRRAEHAPRSPEERRAAAAAVLRESLAQVLGTSAGDLDAESSLMELGLDSLMAVELRMRIQRELGTDVPVMKLLQGPTLDELTGLVLQQLGNAPPSPSPLGGEGRREGEPPRGDLAPAELLDPVEGGERAWAGVAAPPITRVVRDRPLPLSFAQERLWYLDRLVPDHSFYNVPLVLPFAGPLGVAALAAALDEVRRRHEVLRTRFRRQDGEALQLIEPPAPFPLPVIDLSALPASCSRRAAGRRVEAAEGSRPFDLAGRPPHRAALLRLGASEHRLLLTLHHIAVDGWSLVLLHDEIRSLYDSYSRGAAPRLPELAVQYADYAVWQRRWLTGEVLERLLRFWRRELGDEPPVLELPADRPRPLVQRFRGGARRLLLPASVSAAVAGFARRTSTTPATVFLAAFQGLLGRLTGRERMVVGSPEAGRSRSEVADLIGFFANTLPRVGDLSGRPSFRRLLARTWANALAVASHQELPFEKLVAELGLERTLDRNPLFQVIFTVQKAALAPELHSSEVRPTRFDLELHLWQKGDAFTGGFAFDRDLFDATTVERLARRFAAFVSRLIGEPDRRLEEVPVLAAAEAHQLGIEHNDTGVPRGETPLAELFRARARALPEALCLAAGRDHLTYGEVARRAAALARRLAGRGVRPGTVVGVLTGPSPALAVACVALRETGAVYLPLEPAIPAERLRWILDDTRCPVLLASAAYRETARTLAGNERRVLELEADSQPGDGEPAAEPPPASGGGEAAYVIYTSGSTGQPKGVVVPERALASLIAGVESTVCKAAGGRLSAFTAVGFDPSLWEVWCGLTSGASLVFPRTARSPDRIAEWLARERITLSFLPTPLAIEMLREAVPASLGLRVLITGGDVLRPVDRDVPFQVINVYGPTEVCVFSTCARISRGEGPPIGRSLPGCRAYVADQRLRPLPIGHPGEALIGGAGLAAGYVRRPAATAERFVPDFTAAAGGRRLYRSGDLVRRRADGNLIFLGRLDRQVKLRGQRVELGEIEAALARCPGVREAAVAAQRMPRRDLRLVAFVVPADGAGDGLEAALRAALARRLPSYMVPSVFVLLSALPATASGKLDRRELDRRVPAAEPESGEAHVAPRGPVEETLAAIWEELLELAPGRLGAHDDFFAVGGHSLLAMCLASRVQDLFGIEFPVRAVLEAPTVAKLARRVESAPGRTGPAALPRQPRDGAPLPLSYAQRRLWFLDRVAPENPFYNIPFLLRLRGPLDAGCLEGALAEIVRRHETLRTTFATVEGEPVQVIHPWRRRALPRVDLGRLGRGRGAEAERLAAAEARRPFDLERGPVLRAGLAALGHAEHLLFVTLHHICSDGWSIGVLCRELGAHYVSLRAGAPPALPEPPVQYADFAVWQRRELEKPGGTFDAQLGYWKDRLGGSPPLLRLPSDRPRPPVQAFRGAALDLHLPAGLAATLAELGRAGRATRAMTLLAGFYALIHRLTGQETILVGSPMAGRTRTELEPLIGFFVNSLVLVGELAGAPSFRELLARTRAVALEAHAHQDLPFERLVEELGLDRDPSRNPLFQVAFAFQNAPMEPPALPDVEVELSPVETRSTRFDLELHLWETSGPLRGLATYDTTLFDATTVRRWIGQYRVLLVSLAERPDEPVAEASWLTAGERQQTLVEWNDTAAGSAPDVIAAFLRAAVRRPDSLALAAEAEHLSYGELERRAGELAESLRARGTGPETTVAVLAGRSTDLVAASAAILAAGSAYLPLDPGAPPARVRSMLADSGARILVTSTDADGGLSLVPEGRPRPAPGFNPGMPFPKVHPEQTAYVIYTSGSTGRPKGVAVSRGALANLARWQAETFGVGPDDRVTLTAAVSFDASVWEIWSHLAAGASLHVVPEGRLMAPAEHLAWLAERRITLSFLPTPLANLALREPCWPPDLGLRYLFAGGDALRPLARRAPCTVVNLYGPTETCVVATGGAAAPGPSVTVGRPVRGLEAWVADRRLRRLPAGVPGELLVGGASVARGYLGRPALTAERFVSGASRPGGRLYRTGDLARALADGRIEHLGRFDHQVKVRGFRVELGEIEIALSAHPAVAEAAVTAEGTDGERLVAFVEADLEGDAAGPLAAVESWKRVFDERVYREPEVADGDPTLNIAGWTSRFTGRSLGAELMREWRDERVARIRRRVPRRLLEIGCGTGIMLFALAPGCEEYWGTDFSRPSLDYVRGRLDRDLVERVRLLERHADDWRGIPRRGFDAVVLNSVAQYFPSVGYLVRVLEHAVEAVVPGGLVFVGDVRSLPLLEAYHTELALHRADGRLGGEELARRVREAIDREDELVLDPELFTVLQERWPRVERVEIHRSPAERSSELHRFRFDAELYVAGSALETAAEPGAPGVLDRRFWSRYANHPQRSRFGESLAAELARHLRERLPEYMVPGRFVVLDALPRSRHGKIDRKALREPAREPRRAPAAAPRTPVEQGLAAIWEELLERPPGHAGGTVGLHDDFFAAGGHSFLAARLAVRIREDFGVELPLRAVFEAPTVARLAARVEEARFAADGAAPRLRPLPRKPGAAYPLSFAQRRLWFLDRLVPGNAFYVTSAVLPVAAPLSIAALEAALDEIRRRHEALRTSFREDDGEAVQVIQPPGREALPVVDLASLPAGAGRDARRRVEERETGRPFDLTAGPPARFLLLRLAGNRFRLLLAVHHVVFDGLSLVIFHRELATLYEELRSARRPSLPEPPLHYADFAVWQRRRLAGEVLERELRFWRGELGEEPPALVLETDRPRPAAPRFRGDVRLFELPAETAGSVRTRAKDAAATPAVVFLAAFFAVLGRFSGQDRVAVGTPLSGRTRSELEGVVGCFVNVMPVIGELEGDPSLRELVERTRRRLTAALIHQDLPFETLVASYPRIGRRADRHPLFQVVFAFQGSPPAGFRATGVRTARLDLEAHVWQQEETWKCGLVFDRDLFEAATAERLGRAFRRVLAVRDQDVPLSRIPLLRAAAEAQIARGRRTAGKRSAGRRDGVRQAPRRVPAARTGGDPLPAVARIWRQLLRLETVSPEDDFFALGGHSLLALRLLARLKKELRVEVPVAALFEDPTLAGLASYVERARVEPAAPQPAAPQPAAPQPPGNGHRRSLVVLTRGGSRPSFFCVHPLMGVVFPYVPLARYLGADHPFVALEAHGFHSGERPRSQVGQMAEAYLRAVREIQPRGPYRLGGWSLGGYVAYEMARRLDEAGEETSHLVLIDTPVPGRRGLRRWGPGLALAGLLLRHTLPWVGEYFSLRWSGGGAAALPDVLPILRVTGAGFGAAARYRPAAYTGDLTLLATESTRSRLEDPTLGWEGLARRVAVRQVPGSHLSLLREPYVRELAEAMREVLS